MPTPAPTSATQRALLRALLRGAAPAVNFSPHATKNLRRLVLAGQRERLAQGEGKLDQREMQTTTRTLLLLLAAARPAASISGRATRAPVQPSLSGLGHAALASAPSPLLASPSGMRSVSHRAIANLASLTYHHLSPFTFMPRRVARLIGGSDSRRSRRDRARVDEGAPLACLHVPAKPPRGPVHPAELKVARFSAPPLRGIDELRAEMVARGAELGEAKGTKEEEPKRRAFVEAKGAVKAWNKATEKEQRKREYVKRPRRLLEALMEQVQARRLGLGGGRWRTWKEGGWLGAQ